MDMLTQALQTRLPFVHVQTDDIIHVGEVLSFISGAEAKPINAEGLKNITAQPSGSVLYTIEDAPTAKLYLQCKHNGICLVFVNTKSSVLHFNGGVMFPPKDLMKSFLIALGVPEDEVESVLPAYGGMTLKDMYEATMLTINRAGKVSTREVNTTRQGYITKLKGISQIDTNFPYYQCPKELQKWMDHNLPFLVNDLSYELTPRGLLFDGPPGTGKTMGAKYLAQTWGVPLYHLDIGGMKGKYVGDSEGNLHAALAQADQVEPCVVLFDEVEKVFCEQSDSGVTSSLLGSLLWWLQEHKSKVFTVMTTNHKGKIPPELYREGRIDATMMFLGLESESQAFEFAMRVFNAVTGKMDTEVGELNAKELKKKLKALFSEGSAVPQVKITQLVHATIKEMMLEDSP